jgi:hypothetical protein
MGFLVWKDIAKPTAPANPLVRLRLPGIIPDNYLIAFQIM